MCKKPKFTLSCADTLKLLADDTRLKIVEQLLAQPQHVSNLNVELQLEQSLLSHHLKILRDAGMVSSQREGKTVLYKLTPSFFSNASKNTIDLGCCQISFN